MGSIVPLVAGAFSTTLLREAKTLGNGKNLGKVVPEKEAVGKSGRDSA